MLTAVIQEIKKTKTPVTLRQISDSLKIDEKVVDGMLSLLVKKGVICDHSQRNDERQINHSAYICKGCSVQNCPIAMNMPKTYSYNASREKGQEQIPCLVKRK